MELLSSLVGMWDYYRLSEDGETFLISNDSGTAHFDGIVAILLRPASQVEQSDHDKEILRLEMFDLANCIAAPLPANVNRLDNTVVIGPEFSRVYWRAYGRRVTEFTGFYIEADYFTATIICSEAKWIPGA
jgi:hypothetical protein